MKKLVYFGLGVIVGTAAGFFVSKKRYEKQLEEEITQAIHDYEEGTKILDKYRRTPSEDSGSEGEDDSREDGPVSLVKRREMKERNKSLVRKRKEEEQVNYRQYYPDDPAESEYPEEGDYEEDDDEGYAFHAAQEDWERYKDEPPKVIDYNAANGLPEWVDHQTVYYFEGNRVFLDECDCMIEDPDILFGDALDECNEWVNDDACRIVFVVNYRLQVCYEVQKVNTDWKDD